MKRNLYMLLAMALLLAGCSKEENIGDKGLEKGNWTTLSVDMGDEPDARLSYQERQPLFVWDKGDQLLLLGYDAGGRYVGQVVFDMQGDPQGKTAKFAGFDHPDAQKYEIYYHAAQMSVDNAGKVTVDYSGQQQHTADQPDLKDYLLFKSAEKTTLNSSRAVQLKLANSIVCFDLSGAPATVKDVTSLIWESNAGTAETQRMTLTVDDAAGKALKKAYMCFDPQTMKVGQGKTSRVDVNGFMKMRVETVAAGGKNYVAGKRYKATLNQEKAEWQMLQQDNEIWMTTSDGKNPRYITTGGFNIYAEKIEGTDYWTFRSREEMITQLDHSFTNHPTAQTVTLPDCVTGIQGMSFFNCRKLEKVNLPQGVKTLTERTFAGCVALPSIVLPEGLTAMGEGVFENCSALKTVNLPAGITIISPYCFMNCTALSSFDWSHVTELGTSAFEGCTGLTGLDFTSSAVKTIGDAAFRNCHKLAQLNLKGVQTLGCSALEGCTLMDELTLPVSLQTIGQGAFGGWSALKYILVEAQPGTLKNCSAASFEGIDTQHIVLYLDKKEWAAQLDGNNWMGCSWKHILDIADKHDSNTGVDDLIPETGF